MKTLMFPTIHLNGTAPDRLLEDLSVASRALRLAMGALEDTQPNARDYYLQGQEAFGQAVREHQARSRKLRDVRDELAEIMEYVQDQADARMRSNRRTRRS